MVVPKLNPLRFYNSNANKLEDKLSFSEFCEYRNVKDNFKQSFQDYCENIYYKPFIFGEYGFANSGNFTLFNADSFLYYSEAKLKGTNTYEIEVTAGSRLVVKCSSDANVSVVIENISTEFFNENRKYYKNEPIITDVFTTDEIITVTFIGDCTIYGVAAVEVGDDYTFNAITYESEVIDISQYGAVYLISTQKKQEFLPASTALTDYNDDIRKYAIDLSGAYHYNYSLNIGFSGGVLFSFKNNTTATNLPLLLSQRIIQAYDWISYELIGTTLYVEVAFYELVSIRQTGNLMIDTYTVTYISSRKDSENWYLANGTTEPFINIISSGLQSISGVIRAKDNINFALYLDYSQTLRTNDGNGNDYYVDISTFPTTTDIYLDGYFVPNALHNEILVINKTALDRFYGTCFELIIGDYKSEPFEILTKEQTAFRKLQLIDYGNSYETKGMALDVFNGKLLLPCFIDYKGDAEYEIFNGQEASSVLGAQDLRSLSLKTFNAIPNYLTEMLAYIFIFDALKINEVSYAAIEPMSKEKQDDSYKYHIEQTLRENNYEYTL